MKLFITLYDKIRTQLYILRNAPTDSAILNISFPLLKLKLI